MFQVANLINFLMRGLALFGKFILFFFMAKYLEPSELGIYGIFTTIILFAIYVVGLDFYTFSTRELAVLPKEQWGSAIKSQLFLLIITYLVGMPLIIYVSTFFVSANLLWFLAILIFLEHINQEIMRLLIANGQAVLANNLFFIRNGLWCYLAIALMSQSILESTLENIFIIWIIFGIFVFLLGVFNIVRDVKFDKAKISYGWIKKGIKVSVIFLCSTLLVRLVMTLDKLWLEHIEGLDKVAVYTLFFSLSSVLLAFLESGYFSFLYPKMIRQKENRALFLDIVKKSMKGTLTIIFVLSFFMVVFLPFLLNWIGKELYMQHQNIFYILLMANIFSGISMIPHYILYAYKRDIKILLSHALGLLIFIATTFVATLYNIEMSVAYGLLLSLIFVLLFKSYFAWRTLKNNEGFV